MNSKGNRIYKAMMITVEWRLSPRGSISLTKTAAPVMVRTRAPSNVDVHTGRTELNVHRTSSGERGGSEFVDMGGG